MRRAPKGWTASSFGKRKKSTNAVEDSPCFIHPDAPGLCVNEDGIEWVVSHRRSGSFINPSFPSVDLACSFALAISAQGDFRRSAREILADEALRGGVVVVRERPEFVNVGTTVDGWKVIPEDVLDA